MFIHPSHYVGIEELCCLHSTLSSKINLLSIKKYYHISLETSICLQTYIELVDCFTSSQVLVKTPGIDLPTYSAS